MLKLALTLNTVLYSVVVALMVIGAFCVDLMVGMYPSPMSSMDGKEDHSFTKIGCLPCSQKFLAESYFDKENSLDDLSFQKFLLNNLHLCPWLEESAGYIQLLSVHRQLSGEGSHRRLITSMVYEVGNAISRLDAEFCRAVIIERLPAGIFADPFELQHLVQHGAFLDAAVFGDTNLELPSALSNRTVVEIHMNIQHQMPLENLEELKFVTDLPLHVRYPPLGTGGYSRVVMGRPDVLIYCKPRQHSGDCSSPVIYWNAKYSDDDIEWWIPCGDGEHTGIVSAVTFLSAVLSSVLVVYVALTSPPWKKQNKLA